MEEIICLNSFGLCGCEHKQKWKGGVNRTPNIHIYKLKSNKFHLPNLKAKHNNNKKKEKILICDQFIVITHNTNTSNGAQNTHRSHTTHTYRSWDRFNGISMVKSIWLTFLSLSSSLTQSFNRANTVPWHTKERKSNMKKKIYVEFTSNLWVNKAARYVVHVLFLVIFVYNYNSQHNNSSSSGNDGPIDAHARLRVPNRKKKKNDAKACLQIHPSACYGIIVWQ